MDFSTEAIAIPRLISLSISFPLTFASAHRSASSKDLIPTVFLNPSMNLQKKFGGSTGRDGSNSLFWAEVCSAPLWLGTRLMEAPPFAQRIGIPFDQLSSAPTRRKSGKEHQERGRIR